MTEISIIIPAYNEQNRLKDTLETYINYFSKVLGHQFELIVVCNNCNDYTPKIAKEFSAKYPQVITIDISDKIGKGGAIQEGVKVAKGSVISYCDADGAARPEDIWKLAEVVSRRCEGAIGSRWLPNSIISKKQTFTRRLASRIFNLIVRLLFSLPFSDTQCGAKVFKNDAIKQVIGKVNTNGFAFDVDLLWKCKQKGYRIEEVAIDWQDAPNSTLILRRDAPKMLREVLKLRLKR